MKKIIAMIALAISMSACHVVDTGKVGLRVNFDKTIEASERMPGSFNQTVVGSMIDFPVKEIAASVENVTPLASDNSTMKDFDATVVYNINPSAVSELYIKKSHSFNATSNDGDTLLMYSYIQLAARNAIFKVARDYESLTMNDNRKAIEDKILTQIKQTLEAEGLGNSITISQVLVKSIVPSDAVKLSADNLVRSRNERTQKEVEVGTAKLESERIAALNANAGAISYMNAQANMMIAEGVRNGKVNTIIVPADFKGIVNAK